ncbi:MAG: hypothetical protein BEN19_04160 [Epulopiscium sp. Nuni2H_MBin003]|nr:MAG: hypothetical protein BEN19_04160 [Epulopiscium sp. Nuni2H_MBin003]
MDLVFEETIKKTILAKLKLLYLQVQKKRTINENLLKDIVNLIKFNVNINENAVLFKDIIANDKVSDISMHSLEVAVLCIRAMKNARVGYDAVEKIMYSSILHDIGKLVDNTENHRRTAFDMIKASTSLSPVVYIPILHIHEKIDGSGPEKVKAESLHINAQVLHIANNYSNLLAKIPSPDEAVERLQADALRKFDLAIFNKAIEVFYCYPNGVKVELTTGDKALVIQQHVGFPTRPVIVTDDGTNIDMMESPSIFIKHILH